MTLRPAHWLYRGRRGGVRIIEAARAGWGVVCGCPGARVEAPRHNGRGRGSAPHLVHLGNISHRSYYNFNLCLGRFIYF